MNMITNQKAPKVMAVAPEELRDLKESRDLGDPPEKMEHPVDPKGPKGTGGPMDWLGHVVYRERKVTEDQKGSKVPKVNKVFKESPV